MHSLMCMYAQMLACIHVVYVCIRVVYACMGKGLRYAQYAGTCVCNGLKKHIYAVVYALLCMVLQIHTCLHLLSSDLPTMRLRFCRVKSLLYVYVVVTEASLGYIHSTLRANTEPSQLILKTKPVILRNNFTISLTAKFFCWVVYTMNR